MPDDIFFGILEEENGTRLFAAENGKKWTLADLPADIPLGERISVRGVRVKDQPGAYGWSFRNRHRGIGLHGRQRNQPRHRPH